MIMVDARKIELPNRANTARMVRRRRRSALERVMER